LEIEYITNDLIRKNLKLEEVREMSIEKAKGIGAMALFGEKYGDKVRVVSFGESVELCGGTHVNATGNIGFVKIISEASIAAGIRRIQAYTARKAEEYVNELISILKDVSTMLDEPKDVKQSIASLREKNSELNKKVEEFNKHEVKRLKNNLKDKAVEKSGINFISEIISADSPDIVKDLAYQMRAEVDNLFLVLGAEIYNKAHITIMLSDNLVKDKGLNASKIISQISREIEGGGGGQPFYATAGGKKPAGIRKALEMAEEFIK
jgi:alanyl-tRNA synthetase